MDEKGRATRGTVFVALFLAVLMLGLPSIQLGDRSVGAVDNASAAALDRPVRISVIELTTAINTLNPLAYTMGQETDVIFPCYSNLLTRDVNAQIIGDLAESWYSSPDGLVWHFDIVHTATFYNRLDTLQPYHQLTWEDVQYSYYLCRDSVGNSFQATFPNKDGVNVLDRIERGTDDYSFDVYLNFQFAPVFNMFTDVPILPKYIWSTQSKWNWANYGTGIAPCVGSGPWYYVLNGLPTGSVIELARNDAWFATEERGWQSHATKLVWKSETSDSSNLNDFINNQIDVMQYVSGPDYMYVIPTIEGAIGQQVSSGFIVEFCTNQMPDSQRALLGAPFRQAENNQLLLDENVRLAMMMSIDRAALVAGSLSGLGTVGSTIVPDCNPWHYFYGVQPSEDPIRGRAPEGEELVPFDTTAARGVLNAAGWTYDELGNYNPAAYPLAKKFGQDVLRFNYFSVNTQPFLDPAARQTIEWMKETGIDLETLYTTKSSNEANAAWKSADYDVWMWDWIFTPTSEPSLDCLEVMTTMSVRSWNGFFWFNETYNDLYNQSLVEMDPADRQVLLDEMQRMLVETNGVAHAAYKDDLYAMSTKNGQKWQNWGDWKAHWTLIPEQLYPWIYMSIYPQDNPAPQVTPLETLHEDIVGNYFSIGMSAVDDDAMQYRFFFGDGTKSGWVDTPSISKKYDKDGIYTVYLAARESGTPDSFIGWNQMKVRIADMSNLPPTNLDFEFDPLTPTSGDIVTLTGAATDPNPGDQIYFSWDFGDGHIGTGQTVTHQFASGVDSTVTMYVDDRHIGQGTRPVPKPGLVPVTPNTAPTSVVGNYPLVRVRQFETFNVTSTDPDMRDTRVVLWDWGDGDTDVSTLAYGETLGSLTHKYQLKGDYVLKIRVDDQTGLPGHNVSGENIVHVTDPNNKAPKVTTLGASTLTPETGLTVTFNGMATDLDGDFLIYTFDFGDGTTYTTPDPGVLENNMVYVDHVYEVATTPDIISVYVTAYDGQAPPVTIATPLDIEVLQGNRAPDVVPLPERWANMGELVTFTASASDLDGDPLTFYWEFGELGGAAEGNPVTYTYLDAYPQIAYRVWVNDGQGGNSTRAAYIHVNRTFTMNLVTGWNFVSVPLVGWGYTAKTLGLVTGDSVSGWNPASGTYNQSYIVGMSPESQNFPILENTGYWVNAKGPRTLVLRGDVPLTAQDRVIDVPAVGGWAIIGFNTVRTDLWASNITYLMWSSTGNITTVSSYDPVAKKYKSYFRGVPSTDFKLVAGQAYWIYCQADGILSYYPT